ncbi:GNAT family N-acetyltransferase [Micromonospora sp. NPDC049559]|uniref:GNAT family N-acetyltransferase n=1 Tax=Micromonospora sp. NPDC049559 TaxID=3155923 RepID=UPI003429A6F4
MTTTFVTRRLRLREMTPEDFDLMADLLGDPDVMRHYPRPKTRDEARRWIEWNQQLYQERGHGLWAMFLRETGEFVGDCGLTPQRVDGVEELEVGYHVRTALQGRGLATEAASACRDFARNTLRADRLVAVIAPANVPSQRVAEKLGLCLEKRTTGYGAGDREQLIYAMALI